MSTLVPDDGMPGEAAGKHSTPAVAAPATPEKALPLPRQRRSSAGLPAHPVARVLALDAQDDAPPLSARTEGLLRELKQGIWRDDKSGAVAVTPGASNPGTPPATEATSAFASFNPELSPRTATLVTAAQALVGHAKRHAALTTPPAETTPTHRGERHVSPGRHNQRRHRCPPLALRLLSGLLNVGVVALAGAGGGILISRAAGRPMRKMPSPAKPAARPFERQGQSQRKTTAGGGGAEVPPVRAKAPPPDLRDAGASDQLSFYYGRRRG
mmetsp:Transcript_20245/g.51827  ORF Transcript_20245/g.51827 Transcript_20245/m.51827 type:complete len:270 (-) Transcript_20245:290-1099(-)